MPTRELWFMGPRRVEVRSGGTPTVGPGQVLARALFSGISQGTELLLYKGEGPTPFDPSLDVPGAPTYPRRYGYAWVGEVIEVAADVRGVRDGQRIFALAPHGDVHALDVTSLRSLGEDLLPGRAVLAASLETAVTALWDSGIAVGDEVVVIGAGVVGLLVTWLASRAGARVHVVEALAARQEIARALGAKTSSAAAPGGADVVVEATGDPHALQLAVESAAPEATILVVSFYGARTAPVPLGGAFHRRRLKIHSSQVTTIPPSRAPRWTPRRRFDVVRALLADPALDALLGAPAPFDSAPEVYRELAKESCAVPQTVFAYR